MKRCCFSLSHPAVIFLYFAGAAALTMCTLHPAYVLSSLCCGWILLLVVGGAAKALRQLAVTLGVMVLTAGVNALNGGLGLTVIVWLGDLPVTQETLVYGLCAGGMLAAVLQWLLCYQWVMSNDQFLELFGGVFPTVAMMLSMVFRYIPEMLEKGREIQHAWKGMTGVTAADKKAQLRQGVRMATVLTSWSLESSMITAESMEAREYGKRKRTRYVHQKMARQDRVLLMVLLLLLVGCAYGVLAYANDMIFYPMILHLDAGLLWLPVYWGFLLVPVILEGKEMIWWLRWK